MKSTKLKGKDFKIVNRQSEIGSQLSALSSQQGFTLIELAMVLVVIGLMVGLGAGMVSTLTKNYKYTQSRGIIDAAIESATSYAAGTEDIPDNVPANPSYFKKVVTEPMDAFKKDLVYFSDASLSTANSRQVCKKKTAEITVYTCNDSGCTTFDTINNVAFVFVSGGANFNVQTANNVTPPSIVLCPTTQCVTVYEQDAPNIGATPDNYDDIVKWVTLNELKTKAGCLGAPLKILNNELPFGTEGNNYNASIFADGGVIFTVGVGDYKWCIDDSVSGFFAATGLTDPTLGCAVPASCSALTDESAWAQSNTLTFGSPPVVNTGSSQNYSIKVYVRDYNDGDVTPTGLSDNCDQKTFVITVNP